MASIPLFPLGNAVFPAGVLRLRIFEVRYLNLIERCVADDTPFGVVPLLAGSEIRKPEGGEVLAQAGTLVRIEEKTTPMPGLLQITCSATQRFRLRDSEQGQYGLWHGTADLLDDDPVLPVPKRLQACANALGALIAQLQRSGTPAHLMPVIPPFRLDECGWVADRWAELLPLPMEEKAALLLSSDPLHRLALIHTALGDRQLLPPDDAEQDPLAGN
ncbi:LON peptidase substrate-binding domain-containing protein [Bordetella sp. LUAb4]|uniref:LON peptidase substrate-binding domain-containing protein n=1 Tax=Bordetella sp. LUAb4 TaxID=2843195 RepID=UPI001E5654F2|nr:LON peptidase substrate-binding domain-containing protein [Bordetella sp. LUAb4]